MIYHIYIFYHIYIKHIYIHTIYPMNSQYKLLVSNVAPPISLSPATSIRGKEFTRGGAWPEAMAVVFLEDALDL